MPLPKLQLAEAGTGRSYAILLRAAVSLSDAKLNALEDELNFYERTRLVGIHMSKLLKLLQLDASAKAAEEKCSAQSSILTPSQPLHDDQSAA